VSFIIANIYNRLAGELAEIDFFNIHDINPEYQEDEEKTPLFKELPGIFTTHSHFRENFENVILLVRNPWDVLYSYYHYLRGERQKKLSLPEVVQHEKYGIRAIAAHNRSFTKNHKNILIITYEKMHAEPVKEVKKIVDFLDIEVDADTIKTALKRANFKSMRKIEVKKGRKFGTSGFLFTRRGKTGDGKRAFSEHQELNDYILNEIKKSPLLYLLYG
jgi:hypothetical protein